ncbi:DsbA family protein [Modestobacter sp. SSW1-42]|uniref:DsbA family protein n=1 Tax=Modestobacter sp. SSW1-42 TaxID=596372 RepID=UPI0039868388
MGRYSPRVQEDSASAERSGVPGTPTSFVNGCRLSGPFDADTLAGVDRDYAEPAPAALRANAPPAPADLPPWAEDLPETPDRGGDNTWLADAQLTRFERLGTRHPVAHGEVPIARAILATTSTSCSRAPVAVVSPAYDGAPVVRVHAARPFLGAPDSFDDQPVQRSAAVVRSGEVLRLTGNQLRTVLDRDFTVRLARQGLPDHGEAHRPAPPEQRSGRNSLSLRPC